MRLLAALSSGEMDAEELKKEDTQKKVRAYDFKRAVRFSKDHIRSLTRIHENFARYLTTYFSAQLRTFVQINVVQVEQLPYDEFIRSIPKMTILNIFEAEPFEGRMVLEVHPNVAFAMLDRLLGRAGTAPNKIRQLNGNRNDHHGENFQSGVRELAGSMENDHRYCSHGWKHWRRIRNSCRSYHRMKRLHLFP